MLILTILQFLHLLTAHLQAVVLELHARGSQEQPQVLRLRFQVEICQLQENTSCQSSILH